METGRAKPMYGPASAHSDSFILRYCGPSRRFSGMSVTWTGIIMPSRKAMKRALRPLKSKRANAKAAQAEKTTATTTDVTQMSRLFR